MVVAVGCRISIGDLAIYNSDINNLEYLKIQGLYQEDNNLIEEFFQEVSTKINGTIDCFSVLMDYRYNTNFRKKFIQICKTQNNIKLVRFIGVGESKLLGAIKDLSFSPETGDFLWVFDCRNYIIFCQLWKYHDKQQWEFVKGGKVEKEFIGAEKSPTVNDLLKLKTTNPKSPYISVLHECIVDENVFRTVFSEYKNIKFGKNYDWAGWALNYARCSLNEPQHSKYKMARILDRNLIIKESKQIFFQIPFYQSLPFNKHVIANCTKNDVLKIYENDAETETILLKEGEIKIILYIDINGIYTINIINLDLTFVKTSSRENQKQLYFIPKKLTDYDNQQHAVGIDLGTTECCAAVIRKNGPDFVVLDPVTGLRTMPSYIAFDEAHDKCGQIVIDRMKYKAEYTVYDSKRINGKKFDEIVVDTLWPFKLIQVPNNIFLQIKTNDGIDTKSPEEISAILLKHIKKTTEVYEGTVLTEAVITIPSEFSEKQKQATKTAAEMAGWETIHFVPESIAAAFAYFSEIDIPDNSNILICDCGGGTTDICVANVMDGKLQILSFDGDSYLGGRDFDKLLFNHFSAVLKHKYGFDVMKSSKKYVLKRKCQDIKHKLSTANEDWLDVDDFDSNIDEIIKITKKEFEEMSLNFVLKMKAVILRAVSTANILKNSINYVFQVGGGCRMPMIKEMLKEIFPNTKHECNLYPDWVVAHGAALYAYHLKVGNNSANEQKEKPKSSWLNKIFK